MLNNFFNPQSLAVIGASESKGKVGHAVIKNIIDFGFPGKIYPVNPKAEKIMGISAYPSIGDIQESIDLCIMIIPPKAVLEAIEQCGKAGIHSIVIISAGFKETGPEGAKLEYDLINRARKWNMRIIGPNCVGIVNTSARLNATFSANIPPKGDISIVSQSGAILTSIIDYATGENTGFSKMISLGNEADITETEVLEFLGDDPDTNVIAGYIEGVKNGLKFISVTKEVSKRKPIIILKSGNSNAGARAVSSHTGTLAGTEKAFKAAFIKSSIIRAGSIEELLGYAKSFSYQPIPEGDRLAIITNAGGPGILAADACDMSTIKMASFSNDTVKRLRELLPPLCSIYNPVDVVGDADAKRFSIALKTVAEDRGVDGLLVILTPQEMTDAKGTAQAVVDTFHEYGKTTFTSFMGKVSVKEGADFLDKNRIPNIFFPEKAVRCFETMAQYKRGLERSSDEEFSFPINKVKAKDTIDKYLKRRIFTLGYEESKDIILSYDFRMPKSAIARNTDEAVFYSGEIGYPVAMKIVSPDILHKTDVGGVVTRLKDRDEVRNAFEKMMSSVKRYMPNAFISGVSIQEMITDGKEVIIGFTRDQSFGPMLMFGMGGIYVEALKDVSFRLCPLNRFDADSMISEIKSFPLLKGIRGEKECDLRSLHDAIIKFSYLSIDFPEVIEGEINPLIVRPKGNGVIAIDSRFRLKEEI
jgi:acetyltransferase